MNEVVYLKNGGVLRGIIIEQVPNTILKVQMEDKSIVACRYDEIEKITKENVHLKNFRRKPGLAWMLSFFFPGVGQIYNGQNLKGAMMMVIGLICFIWNSDSIFLKLEGLDQAILEYVDFNSVSFVIFSVLMIGLWIWTQIDAPVMANKLNKRL